MHSSLCGFICQILYAFLLEAEQSMTIVAFLSPSPINHEFACGSVGVYVSLGKSETNTQSMMRGLHDEGVRILCTAH